MIAIVFNLLNQQGQIVERLDAQLRPILSCPLWLGCRDGNQKADAVPVLHFIRLWETAAAMTAPTDDAERLSEQSMRLILHRHVDVGRFVRPSGGDIPMYPRSKASTGARRNKPGGHTSRVERCTVAAVRLAPNIVATRSIVVRDACAKQVCLCACPSIPQRFQTMWRR